MLAAVFTEKSYKSCAKSTKRLKGLDLIPGTSFLSGYPPKTKTFWQNLAKTLGEIKGTGRQIYVIGLF